MIPETDRKMILSKKLKVGFVMCDVTFHALFGDNSITGYKNVYTD